jgi:hypothetical protein
MLAGFATAGNENFTLDWDWNGNLRPLHVLDTNGRDALRYLSRILVRRLLGGL